MNILPLVLALALILAVLTVEKSENFKNHVVVQIEYQNFLKNNDRQAFNARQRTLFYGKNQSDIKQLSFRYFIDKNAKESYASAAKQYRLLILALMQNLYSEANFFKKIEEKRSDFLSELLVAIEEAAAKAPKNLIKREEDISRLKLDDAELHEAFYNMLKGTISREHFDKNPSEAVKKKQYVSLFYFINYEGTTHPPRIEIQKAPREILKVVFKNDDDIVEKIIARRAELAEKEENGNSLIFQNEFLQHRTNDIDDQLLDFKITAGDKTKYN